MRYRDYHYIIFVLLCYFRFLCFWHSVHYISTFTHIGRETKYFTKIFKKHNLKISYTTHNSIGKLLFEDENNYNQNKLEKSGVYQLTCPNCNNNYIGQTGRHFRVRFQEHFRDGNKGIINENLRDICWTANTP